MRPRWAAATSDLAPAARLDAGRLGFALRVVRREWCIAESGRLLPCDEVEEWLERVSDPVDRGGRVAALGEPGGHRCDRERCRVDIAHFVPFERAGDARVGPRPDRIGGR